MSAHDVFAENWSAGDGPRYSRAQMALRPFRRCDRLGAQQPDRAHAGGGGHRPGLCGYMACRCRGGSTARARCNRAYVFRSMPAAQPLAPVSFPVGSAERTDALHRRRDPEIVVKCIGQRPAGGLSRASRGLIAAVAWIHVDEQPCSLEPGQRILAPAVTVRPTKRRPSQRRRWRRGHHDRP